MKTAVTIREHLGTFAEARAYLNTTERTLRRWLSQRETNGLQTIARKLGGQWRFKMSLLENWQPPQ
jgi:excisionase family DNA binding protein